jgi:aminomethyltransferase
MISTALADRFSASGARFAEYLGARTVVSFGDSAAELRALHTTCGLCALDWHRKLVITGEDRVRWTNGMVTNNIRDLAYEHGNYNFVLNAQGRIQGDLTIYNRGEYLLATTSALQVERIKEFLDRFIVMDDVEITDVSGKLESLALIGPSSRAVLAAAGLVVPALVPGQVANAEWNGIGYSVARGVLANDAAPETDCYEIWVAAENSAPFWDALASAVATPVGSDAVDWQRILRGVPLYGVDLGERELAQETNQRHALHFTKGCYIGQEIVERVHSRGNVNRTFAGFRVDGLPPATKSKIVFGGKEVGEVTSSAAIPLPGATQSFALGMIRREAAAPGTAVTIDGTTASVAALPFQI